MARSGKISDFQVTELLAVLRDKPTWLALMRQDPFTTSDPLTVEIIGATYVRDQVEWTLTGRTLRNSQPLNWGSLAAGTQVAAIAGFDAATNGRMLFSAPVSPIQSFPSGGVLTIPAQRYFVALDA